MSAILNNQIQPVSETRLSSLAMTSVRSHWLTAKPFVLSLYKCDTTRMVGRPVNSTAIYTSLLISLKTIQYIINYSSSTHPPINIPPTSTHSLHFINPLHIPTQPSSGAHVYPHSLNLINPSIIPTHPHIRCPLIPTQPTSH